MMYNQSWIKSSAAWMVCVLGLAAVPWAAGNGGPFVIKYPGGDPAAKGVLARIDPDLKPAREERLQVMREHLKVWFLQDPTTEPGGAFYRPLPKPHAPRPPLAMVSAVYSIHNPTAEDIEVEFGFPILRGIYTQPWGMGAGPDAQVTFDGTQIRPDLISNSMIYGRIRQRSQQVIAKALAADLELARLVARVRVVGYVRQRAREAVQRATTGQPALLGMVQTDPYLAELNAVQSDAMDSDRTAARQALLEYLTGRLNWPQGPAILMVEYASMELGPVVGFPLDAGHGFYWGDVGEMGRLASANLGRLAAIGEQKTTQLFAELAARFEPNVKTAYEAIFTAWGGDVRERSVDLKTGQVRPREFSLDRKLTGNALAEAASLDPTIYARLDYINPNAGLSLGEKASCEALIKNLPVTFTFAPMNLLHYKVRFPAQGAKTLAVNYKQYAYADTRAPASFQLAYVVHPASLWKPFGPIELEIAAPEGVDVRASVPCHPAGVAERELPKDMPGVNHTKLKFKVAIHRGTVMEKTGELFLAVAADDWKGLAEPKQAAALR